MNCSLKFANIRVHYLNVLEEITSLNFLLNELAGFVYYCVSINFRPFERVKPAYFEAGYKPQVTGAIKVF